MKTCIYIYHQAEVDIIAHWSFQMVIVLQMNIRTPFGSAIICGRVLRTLLGQISKVLFHKY